jgi:hypothetical protein
LKINLQLAFQYTVINITISKKTYKILYQAFDIEYFIVINVEITLASKGAIQLLRPKCPSDFCSLLAIKKRRLAILSYAFYKHLPAPTSQTISIRQQWGNSELLHQWSGNQKVDVCH